MRREKKQVSGGRKQKAEGRRQAAGSRRQKAEGRRQKSGGRKQEAEGRRQAAGGRKQEAGRFTHHSRCVLADETCRERAPSGPWEESCADDNRKEALHRLRRDAVD